MSTDNDKAETLSLALGGFIGEGASSLKALESSAASEASGAAGEALGIVGGIIGGLLQAFNQAAADLNELRKDLNERPTVDGSASDAASDLISGELGEE